MNSINFLHPYLLLLFPIFLLCLKTCPQKEDSLLFSNTKMLAKSDKKLSLISLFKILTLLFLTLTLASPYTFERYKRVKNDALNITLAIDSSLSMKESFKDLKDVLKDFIKTRKGDYFSLLFFADYVALGSTKTKDENFLLKTIDSIKAGKLGEENTLLYDALFTALKLQKNDDKNLIILLSDGIDKGSKTTINDLLSSVQDANATVFTIGFGYDYDEDLLKNIAQKTNGRFYKAQEAKNLQKVFKNIDSIYKKKDQKESYLVKKTLYQIPLFLTFLSLLFYTYLLNKRAVI